MGFIPRIFSRMNIEDEHGLGMIGWIVMPYRYRSFYAFLCLVGNVVESRGEDFFSSSLVPMKITAHEFRCAGPSRKVIENLDEVCIVPGLRSRSKKYTPV